MRRRGRVLQPVRGLPQVLLQRREVIIITDDKLKYGEINYYNNVQGEVLLRAGVQGGRSRVRARY